MECCTGDFCNNGTFPYIPPLQEELPDESSNNNIWIILSIIAVIIAIVLPCFLYKLFYHKKRLVDARIQQDADTYYASDDLLKRTHACGDSTLRVSEKKFSQKKNAKFYYFKGIFRSICHVWFWKRIASSDSTNSCASSDSL